MADAASGVAAVGSANGVLREGDALARALSDEQTFAEQNQTLSDVDQTLSEGDQAAAEMDQAAADMDQAAADIERRTGTDDTDGAAAADLRARAAQQRR